MSTSIFSGRRVFVTGHTGFKGAWLTQWLLQLGGDVTGYALEPPTLPSLYDQLRLESKIRSIQGDVRDLSKLTAAINDARPEFLFHLAAQSLVRASYVEPVETMTTNVMGTVNVLEAMRVLQRSCTAVIVTTDKCYQNREWFYGYREDDHLGGADPYSCSKAMAELAVESWRRSWFSRSDDKTLAIRVATARAGNVIGGGDWAQDRIVPDSVRSLLKNEPIPIRNRYARRPWQHVLDPLHGYLVLAQKLAAAEKSDEIAARCSAFNFGPLQQSSRTVGELVNEVLRSWPGSSVDRTDPNAPHEATLLQLSTEKAHALLNWKSRWDFSTSVHNTVDWYRRVEGGESPTSVTLEQIRDFEATT